MNEEEVTSYLNAVQAPASEADPFAKKNADEMTVRYAIYIGGPKILDLSAGIGEAYVQHDKIARRQLTAFTKHPVGSRDERDEAQEARMEFRSDGNMPKPRVRMKSPKEDAYQIKKTFGPEGFEVCESLSGLAELVETAGGKETYDHSKAARVFTAVVPEEFVAGAGTLIGLRSFLMSSACGKRIAAANLNGLKGRADNLRNELQRAANDSFGYWAQHVTNLKGEWDAYRAGKPGIPELSAVQEELFREVGKPLPAEIAANANRAVVETVLNATQNRGSGNDTLVKELLERDRARDEEMRQLREQVGQLASRPADNKPNQQVRR